MTSLRVPIILFLWALVTSASVTTAQLVLTLDQSNFTQTVSQLDIVLVQFYAPWCGWCTVLFPEFEKAASILSGNDPPITLAKVDATEEKNHALASEYGLKGYPWLVIIKNGGKCSEDYHGPRDAQGIADYLKEQARPASAQLVLTLDQSNFTQTVSKLDIVLVQFYAPWCGWCTVLFPEFEKAASILSGNDPPITLAKVDATEEKNHALASKYGLKGYPWLVIIKNGGKCSEDYHGPRDAQGIADYLKEQARPASAQLVLTLDQSNFTQTVSKLDIVLVQFYAPWCGWCTVLFPEFEKAASILSGNDPPITLAKVDATEEKNHALASEYGLKGYPWLVIIKNGGKCFEDYGGPRDAQGIVDYLKEQARPASTEIKYTENVSKKLSPILDKVDAKDTDVKKDDIIAQPDTREKEL